MADDPQKGAPGIAAEIGAELSASAAARSAAFDKWVAEKVYGSVLTRDTDAFNYLMTAIADLKARLAAED